MEESSDIEFKDVKTECLMLDDLSYYYGEVHTDPGKLVVTLRRELKNEAGELEQLKKYEGEWQGNKMHGVGRLEMGSEYYEGEFYDNEANGQGTYRFENGDIYSGQFMDGLMYGEGSYFTAAVSQRMSEGEATDGVYDAGFEVRSGIRVPPYLSLQEKDRLVEQISEGKSNNFADDHQISTKDHMVDVMVECTKMRRILLLARDKNYKGNLETIMETIDHKKAQYLFYNLADLQDKDLKSDVLFGAKEAMENGFFLILNLDFKTFAKKSEFNTSHHELTDYLSLGFLNRDSSAILKEFDSAGIEPPELIHPEFLVVLLAADRIDLEDSGFKLKVRSSYKWTATLGRLVLGVITGVSKPPKIFETAVFEESVNFENIKNQTGTN